MNIDIEYDSMNDVLYYHILLQMYIVAGGITIVHYRSNIMAETSVLPVPTPTDSVEVLTDGRWATVESLPVPLGLVRGITLDNTVFLAGQQNKRVLNSKSKF